MVKKDDNPNKRKGEDTVKNVPKRRKRYTRKTPPAKNNDDESSKNISSSIIIRFPSTIMNNGGGGNDCLNLDTLDNLVLPKQEDHISKYFDGVNDDDLILIETEINSIDDLILLGKKYDPNEKKHIGYANIK